MWEFNSDYNKWFSTDDSIDKYDFDLLKQEFLSTRFYSKCLSGASYLPVNDLSNLYDILGSYVPRNWYVDVTGSPYSVGNIAPTNRNPITTVTSFDYYTRFISEYGLTLKTLFTPTRLIKDSIKNFKQVDVATTESLNLSLKYTNLTIDGIVVQEGHRVLVKNQTTSITLLSTDDPSQYISGNYTIIQDLGATIEYQYFNSENGIYKLKNGVLVRENDLSDYSNCIRYSVDVKLGTSNIGKQFHLSRLKSGFYPMPSLKEPIEFKEKHNWMLRNRVDYNNLFEINYYDVIKHATSSYEYNGITYSIPQRVISVGEFGVILNNQLSGVYSYSNIIPNKYKVNLRSVSQTTKYYWICGDKGTLLKVRKHDFEIEKVNVDCLCPRGIVITDLKSIQFYDDLRGVCVGYLNTILVTSDGGFTWQRLKYDQFDAYDYNKCVYPFDRKIYIGGNTGVFIELSLSSGGWSPVKKKITRTIDDDDEYLLVDNINDLYLSQVNLSLSYTYFVDTIPSQVTLLFIVTNDGNIIGYDIYRAFTKIQNQFVYFNLDKKYGDILNIVKRSINNSFYFTSDLNNFKTNSGIYKFDSTSFTYLGLGSSYSNTIFGGVTTGLESSSYPNRMYDYFGSELFICGNTSLLKKDTYNSPLTFSDLDLTFNNRLKSKFLVLDYDISSKLNFFTDEGEYRLPYNLSNTNKRTFFPWSNISSNYLSFTPLVNPDVYDANNSIIRSSYTETNWMTYWADSLKTFQHYTSTPMDSSVEVQISWTFSYSSSSSSQSFVGTGITNSITQLKKLAPNITIDGHSRFDASAGSITATPSSYRLYLYDYLMVFKKPSTFVTSNIGDVFRLDSKIVSGNFILNNIRTLSGSDYYYFFTEFNQNIINELIATTFSVTLTNLNVYKDQASLKYKFNLHPISYAYEMNYCDSAGVVKSTPSSYLRVDAQFNNLTSYFNLGTKLNFGNLTSIDMKYTSGFLNFGFSPKYNLLDYLIKLNDPGNPNPKFYENKEFVAMPDYEKIPLGSSASFATKAFIDWNGIEYSTTFYQPENKIYFGNGLKLIWDSLLINTFVDVQIVTTATTYTTEKLLIIQKYFEKSTNSYVIGFHKRLDYAVGDTLIGTGTLNIYSRKKLSQISSDLQELNNIQTVKGKSNSFKDQDVFSYESYGRELAFKFPTDSYAKILLSDSDVVDKLSAIMYVDYKNELAINFTKLSTANEIRISDTSEYNGKLFVTCLDKHELVTGDGSVFKFTGGAGSSEELNHSYFGYHTVTRVTDYDLLVHLNYGNDPIIGNDIGTLKIVKGDNFLNFQPVDLIDVGTNMQPKQSIELLAENTQLIGKTYSLVDVDFEKYRFRLIDGLDLVQLNQNFGWILEAEISNAIIGTDGKNLIWYNGLWECGRWFGGIWQSGTWISGDWYSGTWNANSITDNKLSVKVDVSSKDSLNSVWFSGRWYDGTWNNGRWYGGRWYGGDWNNGIWYRGIWNDGTWHNGQFRGGIWVLGDWKGGMFNCDNEPSFWLDGDWSGGDFGNGIWYNGNFSQKTSRSRFGVKAFNSRTANWLAGKWISGSFYSKLNLDENGKPDVSYSHKFSIWKTGTWLSGEFYGGIAYNMDWRNGTWFGGILEDIQIIGIDTTNDAFILNGQFEFNIGDEFTVIDNEANNSYSVYGTNLNPQKYQVIDYLEDLVNKRTTVYVATDLSGPSVSAPFNTKLRIVSNFKNINWKTGIWTNGIFENGLFESGIWYGGVFNGTWS